MKATLNRGLKLSMVAMLIPSLLIGCTGGATPSGSTGAAGDAKKAADPVKLEKVRVSLWDRSNSPSGEKLTDSLLVKWIKENAKKEGLDVEYVTLPRSQESEKNSTWMASGESPDILITYDLNAMFKWAEQGGLWELDTLLDKYGPDIKKLIKPALDSAGTYKGKRYAIPAMRMSTAVGPSMKIRQDWLDKLNMKAPTTLDELYTVLKAFKEKDPGGVGKDNVVPWAIPAINQGMKAFFYGPMWGAGVAMDGPKTEVYMPTGNYTDGVFHSAVDLPEGKAFFAFMNKLYREGLLSKEFVTDVNSQQYQQHYTSGTAGFIDSNNTVWEMTVETRKTVPTATWVTVEPFKRPNGTQLTSLESQFGLLNLIPKSTKNPEAAVKFLNFLAKNVAIVQSGLEGTHYKVDNGVRTVIDPAKNVKEIDWYFNDLNLLTQGYMGPPTKEQILQINAADPKKEEIAKLMDPYYRMFEKYGKSYPVFDTQRKVAEKNGVNITKYLYEKLSKVIIVPNFDQEWDALVAGWEKNGGREYDKEVTENLKNINWKTTNK